MKRWSTKYRCRKCGKDYNDGSEWIDDDNAVIGAIVATAAKGKYHPGGGGHGLHLYDVHSCDDGSYGFADFIGMELEGEISDED